MNFIENFNDGLIKGVEKKLDKVTKSIDKSIDNTAKNLDKKLTSVLGPDESPGLLDPLYTLLFNFLIKPFNKKAKLTPDDKNIFKIIGMSILLLITSINSYIVDNTIGKAVDTSEKITGYRSDGRRIGPENKSSGKLPILFNIIKTILTVFASLLDLILLAFTNQVDVFTNIVKSLLKK